MLLGFFILRDSIIYIAEPSFESDINRLESDKIRSESDKIKAKI